jgi:hypothetical protein
MRCGSAGSNGLADPLVHRYVVVHAAHHSGVAAAAMPTDRVLPVGIVLWLRDQDRQLIDDALFCTKAGLDLTNLHWEEAETGASL